MLDFLILIVSTVAHNYLIIQKHSLWLHTNYTAYITLLLQDKLFNYVEEHRECIQILSAHSPALFFKVSRIYLSSDKSKYELSRCK